NLVSHENFYPAGFRVYSHRAALSFDAPPFYESDVHGFSYSRFCCPPGHKQWAMFSTGGFSWLQRHLPNTVFGS
ncbi:MAG TPA: hypothetical protein PLU64_02855, partial [Saprospiraceae bacterium]|nr:hypothetical protein [Saprospiraceae bacterium]